ncbi:hypothetical protein HZC34_05930 [Candidatus Saganbacteria bacterium]|nr:hypothetical protein [Candidatus Saganbacteria bacterium]
MQRPTWPGKALVGQQAPKATYVPQFAIDNIEVWAQAYKSTSKEKDIQLLAIAFERMNFFYASLDRPLHISNVLAKMDIAKLLVSWGFGPKAAAAALIQDLPISHRPDIDTEVEMIASSYHKLDSLSAKAHDFTKIGIIHTINMLINSGIRQDEPRDVWGLKAANDFYRLTNSEKDLVQDTAKKTFYILGPALKLLDLEHIALQLEDLALFRFDHSTYIAAESEIAKVTARAREQAFIELGEICELVAVELSSAGIRSRFEYGIKTVASTVKKLNRPNEKLTDAARFRIIIDGKNVDCKKASDIVIKEMDGFGFTEDYSERYNYIDGVVLGNKRDTKYDIGSKPNGYESIHLLFRNHRIGAVISIQIRTERMHEVAEKGTASHSFYKFSMERTKPSQAGGLLAPFSDTYAISAKGTVYKLIACPYKNKITLLDFAFAVSPVTGLYCPEFVDVERYNEKTEQYENARLSVFEELMTGDMVIIPDMQEKTSKRQIPPGRRDKVGTLAAQVIIQAAQRDSFDPTAVAIRSSKVIEIGKMAFDPKLQKLEASLGRGLRNIILREQGKDSAHILVLPSVLRAAKLLGLQNEDGLYLAAGLLGNRDQIVDDAIGILSNSPLAAAYILTPDGNQADVYILAKDVPGMLNDILKHFKESNLSPLWFMTKEIPGGNMTLIVTKVTLKKSPYGSYDPQAQMIGSLSDLRDVYDDKAVTYPERRKARSFKLTFKLQKFDIDILIKVLGRIAEAGINIGPFSIDPEYAQTDKGIKIRGYFCGLEVELSPNADKRTVDRFFSKVTGGINTSQASKFVISAL